MALNIKDPDTDALARELASLTRQPITSVVREALEEKLAVVKARQRANGRGDLNAIIERGRARAIIDSRSADEILGYDENGLPQ